MTTSGINRHGFTLLEIILVATLIAISVAIGAPYFVQSMRGNRLQVGARTVTMTARYARSMAVMRQQTFQLNASLDGNTLRVGPAGGAGRATADAPLETLDPIFDELAPAPGIGVPAATISRTLDGVQITGFRIHGGEWQTEGPFSVPFYPNGTCVGFEVRLQETAGRGILIQVDELGAVRAIPDNGVG